VNVTCAIFTGRIPTEATPHRHPSRTGNGYLTPTLDRGGLIAAANRSPAHPQTDQGEGR
jgi:hypothetical protein